MKAIRPISSSVHQDHRLWQRPSGSLTNRSWPWAGGRWYMRLRASRACTILVLTSPATSCSVSDRMKELRSLRSYRQRAIEKVSRCVVIERSLYRKVRELLGECAQGIHKSFPCRIQRKWWPSSSREGPGRGCCEDLEYLMIA